MENKKTEFNLTPENIQFLETITESEKFYYTADEIVNDLISLFCTLSEQTVKEVREYLHHMIEYRNYLIAYCAGPKRTALRELNKEYTLIYKCLSLGEVNEPPKAGQRVIFFNDNRKYLTYNSNVIILNPEEAQEKKRVIVIETDNTKEYVPPFIYFTNKSMLQFSEKDVSDALEKAGIKFPYFMKVREELYRSSLCDFKNEYDQIYCGGWKNKDRWPPAISFNELAFTYRKLELEIFNTSKKKGK